MNKDKNNTDSFAQLNTNNITSCDDIAAAKSVLRKKFLNIRSTIQERHIREDRIIKIFMDYLEKHFGTWRERKRRGASVLIGIYLSFGSEFNTLKLLPELKAAGFAVAAPVCNQVDRTLSFYLCPDAAACGIGDFGILNPPRIPAAYRAPSEITLLVVPGLAFTEDGKRLGYGGGYYDRYLQNYKGLKVALAYQEQICSDLPTARHDMKLDRIFSDFSD